MPNDCSHRHPGSTHLVTIPETTLLQVVEPMFVLGCHYQSTGAFAMTDDPHGAEARSTQGFSLPCRSWSTSHSSPPTRKRLMKRLISPHGVPAFPVRDQWKALQRFWYRGSPLLRNPFWDMLQRDVTSPANRRCYKGFLRSLRTLMPFHSVPRFPELGIRRWKGTADKSLL